MRRIQQTIDAFRLGDATSPDRARRLEDLGVMHEGETRDLIADRVILPGPADGTFYLSEAGYIYHRDQRKVGKVVVVLALVALVLGLSILTLVARRP
jgi:hypothetical protein